MISEQLVLIASGILLLAFPVVWLFVFVSSIIHKSSLFEIILSGTLFVISTMICASLVLKYFGL